jgi:hypothetical protein
VEALTLLQDLLRTSYQGVLSSGAMITNDEANDKFEETILAYP